MRTTASIKKNINELTLEEKKALVKKTYQTKSLFQNLFAHDSEEFHCKEFSHSFRAEINRILLENEIIEKSISLEKLHEYISDDMRAYNFDDGVNKISTYFYETDAQFKSVYHSYIRFLRENFLKQPFYFQETPTIRIHCPNAKNSNHYPRYHTDVNYGHPPEEINIWLPLTDVLSGHCFRMMSFAESKKIIEKFDYDFSQLINSAINDKDFSAFCDNISQEVLTEFGNMLAFDSRCIHTGVPLEKHTRVSMDIRIIPVAQYEKMDVIYQGSGRRKILFAPGNCYHEKDSDHI